MSKFSFVTSIITIPTLALTSIVSFPQLGQASTSVKVTCDQQTSTPTVIATFSNQKQSQVTPILSFLPQYFSPEAATVNCLSTATKLNAFYNQNQMNYLASDTVKDQPVVCAVERRGLSCDSYNSEVLFALNKPVSPTKLLYDMLGENFKGSQLPSSRTVSRIYTDLRPFWWPF
ncbi:hypothetical protein NIES4102_26140 [Chondrocystis sp. NIES-4102]|nr:hypothetical protein NIES4102_26140 [Chondrocystis sp. NIES-4102]